LLAKLSRYLDADLFKLVSIEFFQVDRESGSELGERSANPENLELPRGEKVWRVVVRALPRRAPFS
jgi:hypothetical protein